MDHGREIQRLLELKFQSGSEGFGERGQVGLVGGEDLLDEDFRLLDCLEQGRHSRGAEVPGLQWHGAQDPVGANGVGDEFAGLVVVADKVAEQVLVGPADLRGGHRAVTLEELSRFQEFSAWRDRDLKALRWLDLLETEEQAVIGGPLGVGEDVVTPHPAEEDEPDEEEEKDGPAEESVAGFGTAATPRGALIPIVAIP